MKHFFTALIFSLMAILVFGFSVYAQGPSRRTFIERGELQEDGTTIKVPTKEPVEEIGPSPSDFLYNRGTGEIDRGTGEVDRGTGGIDRGRGIFDRGRGVIESGGRRLDNPLAPLGETFQEIVNSIINGLIILAVPVVTVMVIWGAFWIITAGGSPDRAQKGGQIILWAAVGFGVLLLSKGVAAIIESLISGAF